LNNEQERLFMVQAVSCVKQAFISRGSGMLDFAGELREIKPDMLVVNEDGNIPEKKKLCEQLGIEYIILKREPHLGLPPRSTTALRAINTMPFRIDIAGGWLDQPFVSKHFPGGVITISLEPTIDFNDRSGMASSTRRNAIDLWGPRLPAGDPHKLAKILFCYDNPPGTKEISGSQDAIGIVFPGLAKEWYEGEYWPTRIESVQEEPILQFLENSLHLIPLGPRTPGYNVLKETRIDQEHAKALSDATEGCWQSILTRDVARFGHYVHAAFDAQVAMFPNMVNQEVRKMIQKYKNLARGWKLSGAGGGGYLILVVDHPIENSFRIVIRRRE
jgi:hypothetical protein